MYMENPFAIMIKWLGLFFGNMPLVLILVFIAFNIFFYLFYVDQKKCLKKTPIGDSILCSLVTTLGAFLFGMLAPAVLAIGIIVGIFTIPIYTTVRIVNKRSLNLVKPK
jgi:hypothetical protein